ncbi:MAG: hypothetical protein MJ196_09285 [Treponemataceae bacterium]|nr:hypothetical protein [Treponemataceae bacterium]
MSEQEFKELKESLKPIFRGYRRMDASMEKKLKNLGFEIIRSKKHYILNYSICKKELCIEVSKTPGDFRSGRKIVRDISKVIRESELIH